MTTNPDIYERHRQAVANWRKACEEVLLAEAQRDVARTELDDIGQELLASCAAKPAKSINKRGRRPKLEKMNGAELKALMREEREFDKDRFSALPRSD